MPEIVAPPNESSEYAAGNSPAHRLSTSDLLKQLSLRMSAQEMELYRLRSKGVGWAVIADKLGERPSLLRKRLSRAIQRVVTEMGLETNED